MTKRGTDWGSLVAGVLFLGLAVAFAVRGSGEWEPNVMWLLPVLAVGLGVAAVARALFRSRPRESEELPPTHPPSDQG
ncbi:hypothetical protein [Nocardiopsis sp. NPDC058789]|uniref:Uncharacterized protein n=1 Tax=Nocardiopsis eucommiae TaxID=2831970 RepID=A0A975L9J7_9ACTN|nr:hypothetical protein KGD82_23265 [Nocardiopsis eucommiae]